MKHMKVLIFVKFSKMIFKTDGDYDKNHLLNFFNPKKDSTQN